MTKYIVKFILFFITSYLTVSFCAWEFNPANFTENQRVVTVLVAGTATLYYVLFSIAAKKTKP